jgi:hypothetical protein
MPNINNNVQKYFWETLTVGGLDLVDASRVEQLVDHLKENKVDSASTTATPGGDIDTFEKSALKELLEDNSWRSLLTDDGVAKLESVLGVQVGSTHALRGRDATGEVPFGTIPGNFSTMIGVNPQLKIEHATALFNHEYDQRAGDIFNNPSIPRDERAKQLLYLLQDYSKALQDAGGAPAVLGQRKELLQAFFEKPLSEVYGAADPDDDLMNNAWEIVWGTNPEKVESSFEIDPEKKWTAYMSMRGEFVETAGRIDAYLKDAGQGDGENLSKFEKKSPLNWIIGEEPGNTKPSSTFAEANAISSTGVPFADKLLDDESVIGNRTLDPSFDLKVDFYAWGNFVSLNKSRGESLLAKHDETGEDLTVDFKEVDSAHWTPVFKNAACDEVEASKVTAVIVGADGEVKGDGKANGSYSASWWGFCDRNAMMGLVTQKYGFPKPNKDVTLTVNGKEHTFNAADISKVVGRRLTEIFPTHNQAGHRYDEEPDQIHLKNGGVLHGKFQTEIEFYKPETYRFSDNMALAPGQPGGPTGDVRINLDGGGDQTISLDDVKEIRRALQSGAGAISRAATKDTIVLNDGTEVAGSLESKINFGSATTQPDGTMVLANSEDAPILGDVHFETQRGEEKWVALSDVSYVVREDINEILSQEALAYIIRNQGVFCADSWTHSSVANGTRTIEEINRWKAGDAGLPDWAPTDVKEMKGYRGEVKNEDNLLYFSMGNKGSSYGGIKFWIETDDNGVPINSKIVSGQWDFLWGVEGKPNWDAESTFNPHMPNDLVLRLYINSLDNPEEVEDLLPSNWRDYLQN